MMCMRMYKIKLCILVGYENNFSDRFLYRNHTSYSNQPYSRRRHNFTPVLKLYCKLQTNIC